MIKQLLLSLILIAPASIYFSWSSNNNSENTIGNKLKNNAKEEIQAHIPITAFWWNGNWDHYDPELLKYIDEIIIFAIPANPNTGDLLKHESSTPEETVYMKGKNLPGLTTTMMRTITEDAKENKVKITLGINGMGRKEKYFNDLVRNNKHEVFADSILSFCKRWEIDGVDIDYEHVKNDDDAAFLTAIVTALGDKLHPEGYHVNGTFGISRQSIVDWLKNNHQLLDQVNVMGYLKTPSWCNTNLNKLHTVYGVPKEKIYCGLGYYAKGKDKAGKTISVDYRDLAAIIEIDNDADYFMIPHPKNAGETVKLEFNNGETSLQKKVDIVRTNKLGGMMVWALNHDVPASNPNSRSNYLRSITD